MSLSRLDRQRPSLVQILGGGSALLLVGATMPSVITLVEFGIATLAPDQTPWAASYSPILAAVLSGGTIIAIALGFTFLKSGATGRVSILLTVLAVCCTGLGIAAWDAASSVCDDTPASSAMCLPDPPFLSTYPVAVGYLVGGVGLFLTGVLIYRRTTPPS